jgi:DNA-binding CsgD family transcriptional regulator
MQMESGLGRLVPFAAPRCGCVLVLREREDVSRSRAVWDLLRNCRPTHFVNNVKEAVTVLGSRPTWSGAILDSESRDDELHDVVTANWPDSPVMRRPRDFCLERAQVLQFLRDVVTREVLGAAPLAVATIRLAESARLSARETDIAAQAVCGLSRTQIADRMGISENTIKKTLRSALHKSGVANMHELRQLVGSTARCMTS